ncbi:hypothetical protein [Streptosporangium vulgare]|uniref:hypothetical protein n=1 Tax=Streptosporangium vulgare TaxID=46190 RepID=UPI003CD05C70
MEKRSNRPPCRQAALVPCHMPRPTATASPVPTSSSVGPTRSPMSSATGLRYSYEVPRSSRRVRRTKSRNCSPSGLSRPICRLSRASCSGVTGTSRV